MRVSVPFGRSSRLCGIMISPEMTLSSSTPFSFWHSSVLDVSVVQALGTVQPFRQLKSSVRSCCGNRSRSAGVSGSPLITRPATRGRWGRPPSSFPGLWTGSFSRIFSSSFTGRLLHYGFRAPVCHPIGQNYLCPTYLIPLHTKLAQSGQRPISLCNRQTTQETAASTH
jgi:hypothetical protein